jgi:hypothetical protein
MHPFRIYNSPSSTAEGANHSDLDWRTFRVRSGKLYTAMADPFTASGTDLSMVLAADLPKFDSRDDSIIPPFDTKTPSIDHVLQTGVTMFWCVIDPQTHAISVHCSDTESAPSGDNAWSLYTIPIGDVDTTGTTAIIHQVLTDDIFEPCN